MHEFVSLTVLAVLAAGCATSHDAAVSTDLVVVSRDGETAVLTSVSTDGASTTLARVPLAPGATVRDLVAGPSTSYGLLVTSTTSHLVDYRTGDAVDLREATVAIDPESVCPSVEKLVVRWGPDGGSVLVDCRLEELGSVRRLVASHAYRVSSDGSGARLGGDCSHIWVSSGDGRALLSTGDTCDGPFRYEVANSRTGRTRALDDLSGERVVIHQWDPGTDALLGSAWRDGGSAPELLDLRRVGLDGSTEVLSATLPDGAVVSAVSRDGASLPIATRPPGSSIITAIDIENLRDGSTNRSGIAACTTSFGAPESVAWSPDSSAVTVRCLEGTYVVSRGGATVRLEPPRGGETPIGLRWSPDGATILRPSHRAGWDLVDPDSGAARPLPPAARALDPIALDWRARPWAPDCSEGPCR